MYPQAAFGIGLVLVIFGGLQFRNEDAKRAVSPTCQNNMKQICSAQSFYNVKPTCTRWLKLDLETQNKECDKAYDEVCLESMADICPDKSDDERCDKWKKATPQEKKKCTWYRSDACEGGHYPPLACYVDDGRCWSANRCDVTNSDITWPPTDESIKKNQETKLNCYKKYDAVGIGCEGGKI